jgi:hypothetical protein
LPDQVPTAITPLAGSLASERAPETSAKMPISNPGGTFSFSM